jgi:hypothetical protein
MTAKPTGSKKKDADDMLAVRVGKDRKARLHAEAALGDGRGAGPLTTTDLVKEALDGRNRWKVWDQVLPSAVGRIANRLDEITNQLEVQRLTMAVLQAWALSPQHVATLHRSLRASTQAIEKLAADVEGLRSEVAAVARTITALAFPAGFSVGLVGGLFMLCGIVGWGWALSIVL